MTQIAAGEENGFAACRGLVLADFCESDAQLGAFVHRQVSERNRHELEFPQHALEKRQLNFDAVLVRMRGCVAPKKPHAVEQFQIDSVIDSGFAERVLPARPGTQRCLVAAPAVIDAEHDHPLGHWIQAVVQVRGARPGINRPGVRHEAGDHRRFRLRRAEGTERISIKTIVEQCAQLHCPGGIKRSGDRRGPSRGHGTSRNFLQGATISTCRRPMPSMSPSTLSPGLRNTGGTRAKPTPEGVPVLMMSPGSSVIPADRLSMIVGMSKIMSRVLPSCITSPLTRQTSRTCCGSGRALLCTIHGPSGQKVSRDFPLYHCPCRRCSSRAVMSRQIVYPNT